MYDFLITSLFSGTQHIVPEPLVFRRLQMLFVHALIDV